MTEFYEIQNLVKLFNPPREDDDSDSDSNETPGVNPNTGEKKPKETKTNPYAKLETEREEKFMDTCDTEIISTDWKKTPKWDISYRQKVTPSDMFLQMGAKTPSTSSCEDMVVTIDLPGEHMQNMDIKVLPKQLEVSSPNFSLNIPLPQPVHPQKGDAKWDKDRERLTVTLRMEREFDFVNF
ncbi:dynein axonemal assembly factor 6 [Tribolium castaneum]|uniref:Protein PIH1D3-like Protein n=1 Tax=Tribolium castaneum TaxID=7070 RepID=D6WL25_TRICA|nr:PREDICTED: protein PIH1D3 [Tribolium castaneum]EFA04053.2 Protein PIH1D3-like Protein [Tribolium castaneum]|eukprot:XP_971577.2 PREDICTED: protein PIH1D3 [Tribolium castaneum]